jgi:hypothetical protein
MLIPGRSFPENQGFSRPLACIIIVWALVNAYLLRTYGIVSEFGEPAKYVSAARLFIRTGRLSSPDFWLYFTQIALLSVVIRFKLSFIFAGIVQLLINLLAAIYFYKTLLYLFRLEKIALIGVMILLLNEPYQQFNVYLQTESIFYSLILILTYNVLTWEKHDRRKLLPILLLLVILCFTRPTGLLFIPPVFLYIFLSFLKGLSPIKKVGLVAAAAFIFFLFLDKAMGSGGELDFMLPFRDESIICGVPRAGGGRPIETAANGNSLYGLLYYITHNFSQFARLAELKTMAFFGLCRDYYSTGHNIYLVIFFYSLHLLALAAIPWWLKYHFNKCCYFLSAILLVWMTVMLSCDDWHNRFYLSISPFVIILSIRSISRLLNMTADEPTG